MATEARIPLSRDRILQAALELVDAEGVDALTMRRLGEKLGFEAMSLYRHVESKDDVLDGLLDLVIAEWEPPAGDGDFADSVRRSAVSVHEALERHRWAATLLMRTPRLRPARIAYMNSLLGRLRESGFDADTTYVAYHVLDAHIFGFSLWETAYRAAAIDDDLAEQVMRAIPWDDLPHLREHRDQHLTEGPHQAESAFALGLDLILEGLEKRRVV
jgi:AcrR family transcriptional regulator